MKLKYKKAILLTTMSTIGIAMLALSFHRDKPKAEVETGLQTILQTQISEDGSTGKESQTLFKATQEPTITPTAALSPTVPPTPTEIPVYPIEQAGTYPEIDELFKNYYDAKTKQDVKTLKNILSDPSKAETEKELLSKTEYIEDYRKIKTYTKKGPKEGTYIVYVYHEIKFTSINTAAPGLAKFYVVTDENNKLKIFSGDLDAETKAYYDARNKDEDVAALIAMTEEKSDKAKAKDEDLQNFWKSIDEMSKKKTKSKTE